MRYVLALMMLSFCLPSYAMSIEGCAESGKVMKGFLTLRQSGASLMDVVEAISEYPEGDALSAFVRLAYTTPLESTEEAKQASIEGNTERFLRECLKRIH